jgi:hypothetical protein
VTPLARLAGVHYLSVVRGLLGVLLGLGLLLFGPRAGAIEPDTLKPAQGESQDDAEVWPLFELAAQAGINDASGSDEVRLGPSGGAVLLVRPLHGLAVGGGAEVARFGWLENEYVQTTTLSFRLRIYGATSGPVGFYAEALAGGTQLSASQASRNCSVSGGHALGMNLGLERDVSSWLRLGGLLGYTIGGGFKSCNSMYDPNDHPAPPTIAPGLALRLAGTFGVL